MIDEKEKEINITFHVITVCFVILTYILSLSNSCKTTRIEKKIDRLIQAAETTK